MTAGRDTVALRVPASSIALGLIEHTGLPLAAPSANRSNHVSPTRAEHVLADLDGRIDLILDSGPTDLGLESTVIDLTASPLRVLRPGPVTTEQIALCLDGLDTVELPAAEPTAMRSAGKSGNAASALCPRDSGLARRRCRRVNATGIAGAIRDRRLRAGHPARNRSGDSPITPAGTDPSRARDLYLTLRHLDSLGLEQIVVVMPPDQPDWAAIRDRLTRATRPARP